MENVNFDFTSNDPQYLDNIKDKIINETTKVYNQVAQFSEKRNYTNTILPVDSVDDYFSIQSNCIDFMTNFHVLQEIRDKGTEIKTELSAHIIKLSMREDMFNAFNEYYNDFYNQEKTFLNDEQNKSINKMHTEFKRMGMYLPEEERNNVKKIKEQLSELENNFSNNVNNENTKTTFTREQLKGVPESWFNSHKQIEGTDDSYEVTLQHHDYISVIDNCECRQTRHYIAELFSMKCVKENSDILKQILELRAQLATKLGYKTFGDYNCENNILNKSEDIINFENNLYNIMKTQYENNIDDLKTFSGLHNSFESYDLRYYDKKYKEKFCDFDMEEIRKYFPLAHTVEQMFSIFQSILGLSFVRMENKNIWHDSVQFYQVIDNSTLDTIGYFYLDLFPREGKYKHFALFELSGGFDTGRNQYFNCDRMPNVGCMACNFPENEPLKFNDVVTLYHEFGHMMHLICCKSQLSTNSSFRTTIDFVETPSQLLEFWCYSPQVLKKITKHTETGEAITDDLIDKLLLSEKLNKSLFYVTQLFYGCVDIKVHSLSLEELQNSNPGEIFRSMKQQFTGFASFPNSNGFASFGHLFGGGYAAGYYSYLRSEAYSANLYHRAFKNHEFDEKVGMKYRKLILERGSSMKEIDFMREFLGEELDDKYFVDGLILNKNSNKREREIYEKYEEDENSMIIESV